MNATKLMEKLYGNGEAPQEIALPDLEALDGSDDVVWSGKVMTIKVAECARWIAVAADQYPEETSLILTSGASMTDKLFALCWCLGNGKGPEKNDAVSTLRQWIDYYVSNEWDVHWAGGADEGNGLLKEELEDALLSLELSLIKPLLDKYGSLRRNDLTLAYCMKRHPEWFYYDGSDYWDEGDVPDEDAHFIHVLMWLDQRTEEKKHDEED